MTPFHAYRLWFTPLSPIHLGTGQTYEPTNYVIEEDALHEFDTEAVMEALSPTDRQAFGALVDRRPDDRMLRAVQKFFYDRRLALAARAIHRVPTQAGVVELYRDRVGQVAQQEGRGQRVINQLEISRTAYTPITREPIMPGSSVKGAIRTALLDQVNNGRSTSERQGLHPFQGKADLFDYYQNRLFPERDPMRLVHLADATWQGDPGMPASEIVFAVHKKKTTTGGPASQQRSTRTDSGPPQILESLPPFRYRAFASQLTVHVLGDVNRPGRVPAAHLRFDITQIAQACNRFYVPILQNELALLSQRGWLDAPWGGVMRELVEELQKGERPAFLLRVGRHCGAESVTLRGVRHIKIMKGQGRPLEYRDEATTIWLAARERDQQSGLLPFGWLLVEYASLGSEGPDEWPRLQGLSRQRTEHARSWANRLHGKVFEWRRKAGVPLHLESARRLAPSPASRLPRSPWVDQKLAELCSKPGIKPDDALRGPALAEAVRAIDDPVLRAQAVADIKARWQEKGWWEGHLGGAAKKAKAIYDELLGRSG
ncbi:RAMP superfamily CRISPR-associated protein [Nitrospira sp. Kam-Ns4a]